MTATTVFTKAVIRQVFIALATVVALGATPAPAAQLVVTSDALEKLLKAQVFRDDGKHWLARPEKCNNPYLEHPSLKIHEGRIHVRARFAGRVGKEVAGKCISLGEPSKIAASGTLNVVGDILSLENVRVEEIEKKLVRQVAQGLIENALRTSLRVNVRELLTPHLAPTNTAPYVVELNGLAFRLIEADADRLRLNVEFSVAVR